MSYITDVVVVLDYITPEDEARLLGPLPFDTERHQFLRKINMDGAGGTKVFCSDVYAAAFNYLPVEFEGWIVDVLARASNPVVWISEEGEVTVIRPDGIVRGVPTA